MSIVGTSLASFVLGLATALIGGTIVMGKNLRFMSAREKYYLGGDIDSDGYSKCLNFKTCGNKTNNITGECIPCRTRPCMVPWCDKTVVKSSQTKCPLCKEHRTKFYESLVRNNKWIGPISQNECLEKSRTRYWDV